MRLLRLSIIPLLLLVPLFLLGQAGTSTLHGTVSDEKGAVLANAEITLTDTATGLTLTRTSGADGTYTFPQVKPATYQVTIKAPGFKTEIQTVTLAVNLPATLNVTMAVGAVAETVEVTSEAVQVNTTDATMGNNFNTNQIQNLPFEGRNVVEILSLQPGVSYVGNNVNQDYDSRGGSVNGARSDQSNITLDGIDNNDQLNGYAFTGVLRSTLDSVQEFRVTTTSGNADAGYGSGAQVTMITKSGTNNLHGSAYFYFRPTIASANDWFNKKAQFDNGLNNTPPRLDRKTYGVTVGGPIKKDKVFFFLNYEAQRTKEEGQITRTVPTASLRAGNIIYETAGGGLQTLTPADLLAMDPLGIGPSQAVLNIWNSSYPLPNGNQTGDGYNLASYTFPAPTPQELNTYIAKIDVNLTDRQNLFVRGNLQNDYTSFAPEFPGLPPNSKNVDNTKGIAVGHSWTITNNIVNSFRYGFIRQGGGNGGISRTDLVYFRDMANIDNGYYSTLRKVPVNNFVDDLTWIKGKHTIQGGINWRLVHNDRISDTLSYNSGITNASWFVNSGMGTKGGYFDPVVYGYPALSSAFRSSYDTPLVALIGMVTQVNTNYNVLLGPDSASYYASGASIPRNFRAFEGEWYMQDTWKVKPNLTLTFGLRHSLLQPPYEANGQQVAPTFSLHDWFEQRRAAALLGQTYHPVIQFDRSGQANGRDPYWAWDYKNFAPRFALAYSPGFDNSFLKRIFGESGKSSIRAGFGMYYDHFGQGIVNQFDQYGSFGLSTGLTNAANILTAATAPRFTDTHTVPASLIPSAPSTSYPLTSPTDPFGSGFAITWGLDDKLKTPYSYAFNLSFERELKGGMTLELAYLGRLGRHLMQQVDLAMYQNLVDPASGMDYFTAATMLSKYGYAGTPYSQIAAIPYWEHMFPTANAVGCEGAYANNTQCIYDQLWQYFLGNETSALYVMDLYGFPDYSINGPLAYYDDQYSSLEAWQSGGTSSYHAGQFILRKRNSHGLQFDFNYTFGKSIDLGSDAERLNAINGQSSSFVYNSWSPRQMKAVSDWDTRHQINSNWIYELPFGKGKWIGNGAGSVADGFIGGWQLSGLFRWTSGLPFGIQNGYGYWPTNWNFTGQSDQISPITTGVYRDSSGDPYVFAGNPNDFASHFRFSYPGQSGQRNNLRGPGYFSVDMGLAKTFKLHENHKLRMSWEVFNVTNSVRFNVNSLDNSVSSGAFGKFSATLTKPRVMQFAARYSF